MRPIKYYPYGFCRNSQGNLPTDKLFTGQRLDSTGLYYYGARYYDPTIGRFISPDTIVPNPADPQSLNRYTYCLNNPLKYTDPSGRDATIISPTGQSITLTDAQLATLDHTRPYYEQINWAMLIPYTRLIDTIGSSLPISQTPNSINVPGIGTVTIDYVPLMPGMDNSPTIPVLVIDAMPGGIIEKLLLNPLDAGGVTLFPYIILRGGKSPEDREFYLRHEEKHVPQELVLGPNFFVFYIGEYISLRIFYANPTYYQIMEQIARIQSGQQPEGWHLWGKPDWWP